MKKIKIRYHIEITQEQVDALKKKTRISTREVTNTIKSIAEDNGRRGVVAFTQITLGYLSNKGETNAK